MCNERNHGNSLLENPNEREEQWAAVALCRGWDLLLCFCGGKQTQAVGCALPSSQQQSSLASCRMGEVQTLQPSGRGGSSSRGSWGQARLISDLTVQEHSAVPHVSCCKSGVGFNWAEFKAVQDKLSASHVCSSTQEESGSSEFG